MRDLDPDRVHGLARRMLGRSQQVTALLDVGPRTHDNELAEKTEAQGEQRRRPRKPNGPPNNRLRLRPARSTERFADGGGRSVFSP